VTEREGGERWRGGGGRWGGGQKCPRKFLHARKATTTAGGAVNDSTESHFASASLRGSTSIKRYVHYMTYKLDKITFTREFTGIFAFDANPKTLAIKFPIIIILLRSLFVHNTVRVTFSMRASLSRL
jgi:hypothetical protein